MTSSAALRRCFLLGGVFSSSSRLATVASRNQAADSLYKYWGGGTRTLPSSSTFLLILPWSLHFWLAADASKLALAQKKREKPG